MANKELVLSDKDNNFIAALFNNNGNIRAAAEEAGFSGNSGYAVFRRLSKEIAKAAQEYLAMHSLQASVGLINESTAELPNPARITALQAILDRAGVIKYDPNAENQAPTIRQNIFILPEKRQIVDTTFTEI